MYIVFDILFIAFERYGMSAEAARVVRMEALRTALLPRYTSYSSCAVQKSDV